MIEIERKYLVHDFGEIEYDTCDDFWQGYLAKTDKCSVRVRIEGDLGVTLCIKSAEAGMSRFELEVEPELPSDHDEAMAAVEKLKAMCEYSLSKTRHYMDYYNKATKKWDTWEIDKYHGDLEGLVTAEIEIPYENYIFEVPYWVDEEVTHIGEFYNYSLAKNKTWPGRKN